VKKRNGLFSSDWQSPAMETSLHRQLKELYADTDATIEVPLGRYRIDVVCDEELIEIQHGSLAAIRDKVANLLRNHRMLIVKPIIVRKQLVQLDAKGGQVTRRRLSPKKGSLLDLFDDLVHFTRVFPHRNLVLETPLVDIEEWRYPGHGRRRRRRANDHQVEDQKLTRLHKIHRFRTASDLLRLIPRELPRPFHTGHLAATMDIPRWVAQRIAYCLRKTGAVDTVGKQRNALLYQLCS
jgi:hypothetical protein